MGKILLVTLANVLGIAGRLSIQAASDPLTGSTSSNSADAVNTIAFLKLPRAQKTAFTGLPKLAGLWIEARQQPAP